MSVSTYVRKRMSDSRPAEKAEVYKYETQWCEGWAAFYSNEEVSSNPYSEDLREHKEWLEGYRNAQWDYELETELEAEEEYENYDEDDLY